MTRRRTAKDVEVQTRIVADAQTTLTAACVAYIADADGPTFREMKKAMHNYELAFVDYSEIMADLDPLWHAPEEDLDPSADLREFGREFDRSLDPERP